MVPDKPIPVVRARFRSKYPLTLPIDGTYRIWRDTDASMQQRTVRIFLDRLRSGREDKERRCGAVQVVMTRLHRSSSSAALAAFIAILLIALGIGVVPVARAQEGPCSDFPLPEAATLIFGGDDFDDFAVSELCRGIVEAELLFDEFDTAFPAVTIYVENTAARARRRQPAPVGRKWGNDLAGVAFGRRVVILLSRGARLVVVHELIHTIQAPIAEAQWLAEGAAEYISRRQSFITSGVSLDTFPNTTGWAYDWTLSKVDLSDLESRRAFNRSPGPNYLAGRVGFHLLVLEAAGGLEDYFGCFVPEKARRSWRSAFSRCFGMTVSGFYDAFDDYRASGFTETRVQRRERERVEFRWRVDSCMVNAVSLGSWTLRSMC
ncbi:MAG: hypothetical protein BMS9Abin17_0301 [Acidimicrobiia bacterium]|nr:MAG: hypothetical protein BMS9Abin17_0301 [Acidimicrobiia bacterium]